MRVIKPQYLTPMPAVLDDGRRLHCIVTVMFHAKLDGELCEERLLWEFATDAVEGMVLDEGMPKPNAEWLVHGSCFARGPGVQQSFVKVTVGGQEKVLAVFGKRSFSLGEIGTPEPFESVPIRFSHAFGGEGFADNPIGKGYGTSELPQVEVRSPLIQASTDRPPVASFGRIDVTSPQRTRKSGTYDTRWYKTRYPGLAEDFDSTYFQLTAADQWKEEMFEGNEPFTIVNMHPEQQELKGKLPGVIARCFVKRRDEDPVDVPMRIDTVHFFPDRERQVIVCRGTTTTRSDLLDDIEELACGLEWIGRPKPREHYEQVFATRRRKDGGALASLDDTPLLPETAPKAKELIRAPGEGLKERSLQRRLDHEYEKARQTMIDNFIDPDRLAPKPKIVTSVDPDAVPPMKGGAPTIEDVKKQVADKRAEATAKLRAEIQEASEGLPPDRAAQLKARAEAVIEKMEIGEVGPPAPIRATVRSRLEEQITLFKNADRDPAVLQAQLDDEQTDRRLRDLDMMKREAYRKLVQHQGIPPALGREASEPLRVRATIHVGGGEPFEGLDLTGADLSGLDLRGADLRGAWLEAADLTGAQLEGAALDKAVLARAKLPGVSLRGCTASGANFSEADLTGADLSDIDLTGSFFVRTNLTETKLAGTRIDGVDFTEARLVRTDLSGCKLKNGFLVALRFEGASLRGCVWDKATLYQCDFVDVDARGAEMNLVLLVDPVVERTRFDDAKLVKFMAAKIDKVPTFRGCTFVGARVHLGMLRGAVLDACDFSHADLEQSDFSGAVADGSTFESARGVEARFVSASVRGCKFDRADLMSSMFASALMDDASFEDANLFRSDFGRSVGAEVNMKGANVKRVRTVPKRDEAP